MILKLFLRAAGAVGAVVAFSFAGPESSQALGGYPGGAEGYDISYPQCGRNYPAKPFNYIIVGVNGGRPMTPNECFAHQVAYAREGAMPPSLYVNTSSPPVVFADASCPADDYLCTSYKWGETSARYALQVARAGGAGDIKRYWLDVETANYWSANKLGNAYAISAMKTVLESEGMIVGIYSTHYQYGLIAGDYQFPGTPLWIPGWSSVGDDHYDDCKTVPLFAGGYAAMLQWTLEFDGNFACPGNQIWAVGATSRLESP